MNLFEEYKWRGMVSDVTPDVVGVVGDDPGDEVPMTPDDREVEDGYEPANV